MKNPSELVREFMAKGRADSCPVIDMHGHLGPYQGIYFPNPSPEDMIGTMDRAGVRMIVSSSHAALTSDPKRGNRLMAEVIKKYPDRFRGYWCINPNYYERMDDDIREFSEMEGFVGFKFLSDYHKYPLTSPKYELALKHADENRLLILMHTWGGSPYDSPSMVPALAEKYPNVTFLMGHSGYGDWGKSIQVAKDHTNVYLELCAAYRVNGLLEWMVQDVGSGKILFGTDLPWFDPHYGIGCILFSKIRDEDRHNILHRNAERILGL